MLRAEIPLPNFKPAGSNASGDLVQSPQNPYLTGMENLASSHGFEGMQFIQIAGPVEIERAGRA